MAPGGQTKRKGSKGPSGKDGGQENGVRVEIGLSGGCFGGEKKKKRRMTAWVGKKHAPPQRECEVKTDNRPSRKLGRAPGQKKKEKKGKEGRRSPRPLWEEGQREQQKKTAGTIAREPTKTVRYGNVGYKSPLGDRVPAQNTEASRPFKRKLRKGDWQSRPCR